jgi:serine/threonine protein phosphatase PrpC
MSEHPSPTAKAAVVGVTDVGRVREHNEDNFLVLNRADGRRGDDSERVEVQLDGALLLVVCDGMGGAAAGEIASRMATERMAKELGGADFANSSPDQIAAVMDKAVQLANSDIHEAAKANPAQKGMGTTMTAAVVTPGRLFVSQVGDSRAYLLRKNLLNQLTKDQSLIGQLIEEGTLTEEEAEKLGGRNIVLQAVGVEENLRVDTKYWPLLRGDVLLVCSDGLSGMVKDARMKEILLAAGEDVGRAAKDLIAEANANGGRDNVTSIVARFDGEALRPPMESAQDGEMQKAGVAFKAPPPPDVENPMRRMGILGLAVLAVIAALFFALRKTTADVQVTTPPGLAVHLKLIAPDGKVRELDAKDGVALFEGVPPSDKPFVLVASAAKHEDDEKDVAIAEAGQAQLSAEPVPKRGTVSVQSLTPRVDVRIQAPGTHKKVPAHDQTIPLPVAEQERTFGLIPAGEVTVSATRQGFRSWTKSGRLDPEGTLAFEVPKLDEVKGRLAVNCSQSNAAVEVFDDQGEPVAKDSVTDGRARLSVRVGRQSVRVTKTGFKEFTADVDVTEGAEANVQATLEVVKTQVTLIGPADAEFEVMKKLNNAPPERKEYGSLAGGSRKLFLEPGNYELRWQVGADVKTPIEFSVAPGGAPMDVQLR